MNNKTVKIWLLLLICAAPALAEGTGDGSKEDPDRIRGWEAAAPPDPNDPGVNWLGDSHAYATDQARVRTEGMERYFG